MCACLRMCVQVVLLQRQLGEALAELQANRERLAEVQAIQVCVCGGGGCRRRNQHCVALCVVPVHQA